MPRVLPELTPENTPFWTGGQHDSLLITQCDDCNHAIHPPQLICSKCNSRKITAKKVSGRAKIASYTINHQQWTPELNVPFALVIAQLDDCPNVRITAEVVDSKLEDVKIDAPLEVRFQQVENIWIPQFKLA